MMKKSWLSAPEFKKNSPTAKEFIRTDNYDFNTVKKELIEKLGLSDRIKILTDHSYESIEDIYKNASGLIVSSLREGGPRTVLEAINHNIPVLGTNVGIMPQIIPRDLLTEAGDQVSLTALLEEMIPLLPQLDVSAIKIAMHEEYSLENACIKTKEVYFSL